MPHRRPFSDRGQARRVLHKQNEQKAKQSYFDLPNEKAELFKAVGCWHWVSFAARQILLLRREQRLG